MSSEVYELNDGLIAVKKKIRQMLKSISRPLVVGIAGGSGSGKTTKVAKKIQDYFPGSAVLSTDDYFKGKQFMESIGSDNWDEPRVLDLELLKKHLEFLKAGTAIWKPVYSFKTGSREGYALFDPSYLIITEGIFALHDSVADQVDLKIFVDISVHGSLLRRLIRDMGRTGRTEKDIFKQYVETVYPMYKPHIEPAKSRADIIIINQCIPELEAGNCKIKEFQIKVRLKRDSSPMELKKKLEKLGFEMKFAVLQKDTYYRAPNWLSDYSDELMRVREEGFRYFLAYKGPFCEGPFGAKPKIEFEVEPRLKDSLEDLGYKKLISFAKKREKFFGKDNLEIAFDDFLFIGGKFFEFRAKDENGKTEIFELLKKLGIKKKDVIKKSYLELLLEGRLIG